jgi:hypothetical protein
MTTNTKKGISIASGKRVHSFFWCDFCMFIGSRDRGVFERLKGSRMSLILQYMEAEGRGSGV